MEERLLPRRNFLCGLAGTAVALAGISRVAAEERQPHGGTKSEPLPKPSAGPQDFRWLIGALEGFSATLVGEHVALLERCRHRLVEVEAKDRDIDLALADPLASRWRDHVLSWAELHNSVRLHELYFETLTPKSVGVGEKISKVLASTFGSYDQWWVKFRATAVAVRAWAALVWDKRNRRLFNVGLDHDSSWPIELVPLLVVDMAEHAYVLDFVGRPYAYLDAWIARVDWESVEVRLAGVMG
jgi:Fe-Mn family superoxide dismutase